MKAKTYKENYINRQCQGVKAASQLKKGSIRVLLGWWQRSRLLKKEIVIGEVIPFVIMWTVWNPRNECLFNGAQHDWEATLDLIKIQVALWVKFKNNF